MWSVQFIHSAALWLSAAAAAPLIIHLLARRKPQVVPFPAVQFIQKGSRKGRTRSNLKHLLLMLLRMLIIVLAVLAVSRPILTARRAPGAQARGGPQRGHAAVIVVDDSLSMNYRRGGSSWFETAQDLALQALDGVAAGSHVGFATTSRPRLKLSRDRQAVRSRIAGLRPGSTSSSCWRALELAADVLRGSSAADRHIMLFTDMTRSAWQGLERRGLKLGGEVALTVVDVGEREPANLAVTALRSTGEPAVDGAVIELQADVLSVGRAAQEPVQAELDGEVVQRRVVKLAPDAAERLLFRIRLKGSGHHWGRIAFLKDDPLPQDNARTFALDAAEAISVLCVEEQANAAASAAAYFFRLALNPWRDAARGTFRVTSVTPQRLGETSLSGFDVIALADVPALDPAAWQRLSGFVSGGGGLLVFFGQAAEPRAYGAGQVGALLPAEPGEVVEAPPEGLFRLRSLEREHAIMRGIARSGAELGKAHFGRCRRLKVGAGGQEVLSFGPDLPALVLGRGEAGRAAVFASGADGRWGNFPKCPVFVPFCQELALWLSGRAEPQFREFRPGEHVPIRFETSRWPTQVAVTPPGATGAIELLPGTTPGRRLFWDTDLPGYYGVTFSRQDTTWRSGFAVNTTPIESDVRKVSPEELREGIEAERLSLLDGSSPSARLPGQGAAGQGWQGTELAPYLILLALAACAAESFLANRFYRRAAPTAPRH